MSAGDENRGMISERDVLRPVTEYGMPRAGADYNRGTIRQDSTETSSTLPIRVVVCVVGLVIVTAAVLFAIALDGATREERGEKSEGDRICVYGPGIVGVDEDADLRNKNM